MSAFSVEDRPQHGNSIGTAERNSQILKALANPRNTLQSIADKWGITRERVRQIGIIHGAPNRHLRGTQREEFLRPYMDAIGVFRCILCRDDSNVEYGLCCECRKVIRDLYNLNCRLRNGSHHDLIQATWIIRRYGFTPDDLRQFTN